MNRSFPLAFERPFWVVLYVLSPAAALVPYFAGNWGSFFHSWSLSMTFGIIGYIWYLNQFIIAARPAYWDRLYGLDGMYRFHGYMAIFATVAVVAHVVLKRLVYPVVTVQQFFGIAAVVIFVAVVIASLLFMVESRIGRLRPLARLKRYAAERRRWQYHHLKRFHNLVVVAAFLVLAHVLLAFSTLESFLRISVMTGWFVVALGLYLHRKVIKPARSVRHPWTVDAVVAENPAVTTVRLVPPEGVSLLRKAGQFAYFRFPEGVDGAEDGGTEEHPFTLSSPPGTRYVEFTAKNLGDFSGALPAIRPGAPALIDGAYGIFRPRRFAAGRPLVLIAGGIGITPFLSILGDYAASGTVPHPSINLIWSLRTVEDLCVVDRLTAGIEGIPELQIELFFSREERVAEIDSLPHNITRSAGRVGVSTLEERGLLDPEREFFLCGPRPMMEGLITGLRACGVKPGRIHFEAFAM
ncbi:MAG: hypothetical protein ACLFR8_12830 [Alkalispirochaeta sp.]